MKKIFIIAAVAFYSNANYAQPLLSYGNSATEKDEFLRAYNKNKPSTSNKEKSIREYLQLYTNFKLKVKEAQELRLDTVAQIKYDVQNFRDQITLNYLNDEGGMKTLINEAAERSRKDVHVVYFIIPVTDKSLPADTVKAYNAAKELYSKLKNGADNYAEMVTAVSLNITAAKYNDAGFITAFSVPYALENVIYNTKPGSISAPYKTAKGWVLFKVLAERKNTGKWKAAQLLFAYPPDADFTTKLAVKEKADSVYELLQKGLSFSDAAKTYSNDRLTNLNGGEMPEFYTGKYHEQFEKNVFALKTNNSVSNPFETSFGYHIVKRLSNTMLPEDKNDPVFLFDIKQKVQQDERINTIKEKFVNEITAKTGFKKIARVDEAEFIKYADSIKGKLTVDLDKFSINKKPVFSFNNGAVIKGNEWIKYLQNNSANSEMVSVVNKDLWKNFKEQQILNFYKLNLDKYNNDFKYQMQEFTEGNMLFEIMERKVWSKAGLDSVGLVTYYNANKAKYMWQESADVLIFNCTNEQKATEALEALKTGKTWAYIVENSDNQIQADSGRYEISQLPNNSNTGNVKPKAGNFSSVIKNTDGTTAFVKYIKLYDANMQRTFSEARGLVINDYQNVLEEKWLETLRKKYVVRINNAVLNDIIK